MFRIFRQITNFTTITFSKYLINSLISFWPWTCVELLIQLVILVIFAFFFIAPGLFYLFKAFSAVIATIWIIRNVLIALTIFTCIILAAGAIMFANDTQELVINPITKMVGIIKTLADDPLQKPEPPTFDEEEEN